jgi:hypothetical protein
VPCGGRSGPGVARPLGGQPHDVMAGRATKRASRRRGAEVARDRPGDRRGVIGARPHHKVRRSVRGSRSFSSGGRLRAGSRRGRPTNRYRSPEPVRRRSARARRDRETWYAARVGPFVRADQGPGAADPESRGRRGGSARMNVFEFILCESAVAAWRPAAEADGTHLPQRERTKTLDGDLRYSDFRGASDARSHFSQRLPAACDSARGAGGVAAPPSDFRVRSLPGAFGEGRKSRETLRA